MKFLGSIFALIIIITSGCKENVKPLTDTLVSHQQTATNKDFALKTKWVVQGLKMPESVFASKEHEWLYVSNVNGTAPGFLSKISKDGTIKDIEWITGLESPTGSDLYKDKLYVADVKQLHIIDINRGQIIESINAHNVVSLNDVSINQNTGQVFISDIAGGKIYTLENRKLEVWFEHPEIIFPNGICVKENSLIVANYGLNKSKGLIRKQWLPEDFGSLYSIDISSKKMYPLNTSNKKGVFDGVTESNGVVLASSNPTGQLYTFDNNKSYLIDTSTPGLADINTDGKIIYAPYLFGNKLVAFEKIPWDRITTEQEYLEKAADNFYGDTNGSSVATSDGLIRGKFGKQNLMGTWNWKGEYFCRTSTLGNVDLGYNCIQIDITATKMRLILDEGEGISIVYDKKEDQMKNSKITVLSKFNVKSEYIEMYKKAMLENQELVKEEEGNLEMRLFVDKNNPNTFFVYGVTKDQEALNIHTKLVEERGIVEKMKKALAEKPITWFLEDTTPLPNHNTKTLNPEDSEEIIFFVFDTKTDVKYQLIPQFEKHVTLTREEEGNILFDFYTIKGEDSKFVVYERWRNKDAVWNIHMKQPHSIETGQLMEQVLKGEMKDYLHVVKEVTH